MRPLLLLLALLFTACGEMPWSDGASEDSLALADRVGGLWVQDTIDWSIESDSVLEWRSTMLSLVLHRDGHLSLQTRGVEHAGRDSVAFGSAADRVGYSGRWWTIDSSTAAIEYRLTYSDLRTPDDTIPGALRRDTLRREGDRLVGLDYAERDAPGRALRLQRPVRLARESVRVLTWRDSLRGVY